MNSFVGRHSTQLIQHWWAAWWFIFCYLVYVLVIITDQTKAGDLAVSFCQILVWKSGTFSEFHYPIKARALKSIPKLSLLVANHPKLEKCRDNWIPNFILRLKNSSLKSRHVWLQPPCARIRRRWPWMTFSSHVGLITWFAEEQTPNPCYFMLSKNKLEHVEFEIFLCARGKTKY